MKTFIKKRSDGQRIVMIYTHLFNTDHTPRWIQIFVGRFDDAVAQAQHWSKQNFDWLFDDGENT